MIHNTAAKRRSKTHLTFVGCVLLCARDGICIYNRQHTKERHIFRGRYVFLYVKAEIPTLFYVIWGIE